MMKKRTFIFLLILLLGFVLRFVYLAKIPPELNRDEASVGFNAYSILKTHKDEHGRGPWPLVFRAFGDYKIPGYIYLIIPLVNFFGLNAFTVRFPSAFFGSLTILVVYFLVKEIWPRRKNLALMFPLLLSLTPFHLQYSRQQFEATVALFFSLTGTLFLLKARKKQNFLWVSLPFFIISFFIYNSPLFIIPVLVLWTFLIYRDLFLTKRRLLATLSFIIILLFSWLGYFYCVREGNQGRANTTIFNQIRTVEKINHNIHFLTKKEIPLLFSRLLENKPAYWLEEFMKNYLAAFNPKFIFFTSDNNSWHSLGYLNFGNIVFIFLPFVFIGFLKVVKGIKEKKNLWILGYFFISPVASGLTIDSPILTRLLDFHLILVFFSAIGLEEFWRWRIKHFKIKNFLTAVLLLFFTLDYLISYFIIFPQSLSDFWLPGIKEACQIVKKEEKNYDLIVFNAKTDVGYIFPAFYFPFDPADFQNKAKRTTVGFDTVNSYAKYTFNLNNSLLKKAKTKKQNILLIKRLNREKRVTKTDNDVIIYDSLGRGLWKISKLRFH